MAAAVAEKPKRSRAKAKAVVAEAEPVTEAEGATDGFGAVTEPEEFAGVIGEPEGEAQLAEAVEAAVVARETVADRQAKALVGSFGRNACQVYRCRC